MTRSRASALEHPVVHALTAPDGWVLRVYDFVPRCEDARGIVILGHAMMVDARTVCRPDRPTIAATLVDRGFRVLAPDLRGHGASGPGAAEGGEWSYDDHVSDVGLLVAWARELAPELPLHLVGHSLFGNASLAWLGQHPDAQVHAAVLICADIWCKGHEPRWWRWALKRLVFAVSHAIVKMYGRLPARALKVGTADECARYWAQFARWIRGGCWTDEAGRTDYGAGVGRIQQPVLHVVGRGDRLYAAPESSLQFTQALPRREVMTAPRHLASADGAGAVAVGHMSLVTDPACVNLWEEIALWLVSLDHEVLAVPRR